MYNVLFCNSLMSDTLLLYKCKIIYLLYICTKKNIKSHIFTTLCSPDKWLPYSLDKWLPYSLYRRITYWITDKNTPVSLRKPALQLFMREKLVVAILWTQLAHCLGSTPHLLVAHSLKLLVETIAVVWLRVAVDRNLSLITSLH